MKGRIVELESELAQLKEKLPQPPELGETPPSEETAEAAEDKGWFQTQYQFDTRAYNTFNVEGATQLPLGFSIWGFIDVDSPDRERASRIDLEEFFTELDLKREVWKGLGPIAEYNDADGPGNNLGRFGLYYEPKFKLLEKADLWLFTKWFPVSTTNGARQGSFAWNWAPRHLLWSRFSTGGFFDLNFSESGGKYRPQLVTEIIFRYRLLGDVYATLEYKYNEFLSKDQETGWAFGLQYFFS